MEIAFPDAYEKAVAEAGIEPVGQPNLTDFVTEDGEFRFKAVVPVKPELSLKAYKGLSAEKRTFEVTDADVEAELERLADEIEQTLQNSLEREIHTEAIGEQVMEKLKGVDEVAYVRFASVYRQFKDINTSMAELNKLLAEK